MLRIEVSGGISDQNRSKTRQPSVSDDEERIVTLTFVADTGGTATVSIHAADHKGSRGGSFERLEKALKDASTAMRMNGSFWTVELRPD